ncbi:uncharacterized protein LOC121410569 [Lytechinus variegatus]|uniref:uncharacterized protein LOC121410569 n=1 Tax=Lytechinus variegatus TaxID=7654 RepID=UPI001BB1BB13|nr:uncharacterized protein LOC121410569 [Lytechinus variegatus]
MADCRKNEIVVIVIALLMLQWTGKGVEAVSQFLNDAAFSIVDPELSVVSRLISSSSFGLFPQPTMGSVPAMTAVPPMTAVPSMTLQIPGPPNTQNVVLSTQMLLPTPTPSPTPVSISPAPPQNINAISGFISPVLLRDDNSFNTSTGIFTVDDDGVYVFVIHRPGVHSQNPDLTLTVITSANPTSNQTLATLDDTGDGSVTTTHVVADLRRGDRVFIDNPGQADVVGTADNPFIYNGFLLYHTPISPAPKVRQSAFWVSLAGNLSREEGAIFSNYNPPALNINDDFDAERGTFLTSLKGLYIFHLSATFTTTVSDAKPAITVNVNNVERARGSVKVNPIQISNSVGVTIALPMVQGDIVELFNVLDDPNIDFFLTFSGYLLA